MFQVLLSLYCCSREDTTKTVEESAAKQSVNRRVKGATARCVAVQIYTHSHTVTHLLTTHHISWRTEQQQSFSTPLCHRPASGWRPSFGSCSSVRHFNCKMCSSANPHTLAQEFTHSLIHCPLPPPPKKKKKKKAVSLMCFWICFQNTSSQLCFTFFFCFFN